MSSRVKSEGPGIIQEPWTQHTRYLSGGEYWINGSGNSPTKYEKYRHKGVDTPGFHQLKREGKILPMTPWDQYHQTGWTKGSVTKEENTQYSSYYEGPFRTYPRLGGDFWFREDLAGYLPEGINYDALVANAAAAVYASGFDGLTFLAELHKTVRMFKNLLRRNLDNLLSGQLYKNWLEYRYGWRILIFEMQDLYEVMTSYDDKRKRFRQSVGYSQRDITSETYAYTNAAGTKTFHEVTEIDFSVRGIVVLDLEPPKISMNPVITAWEVIPYSFVIDWFVGVGKWLESVQALALSSDHTAAWGYKVNAERRYTSEPWDNAPGWDIDFTEEGETRAEQVKRNPSKIPITPQVNINLDLGKIIDMIALIAAAGRGR